MLDIGKILLKAICNSYWCKIEYKKDNEILSQKIDELLNDNKKLARRIEQLENDKKNFWKRIFG